MPENATPVRRPAVSLRRLGAQSVVILTLMFVLTGCGAATHYLENRVGHSLAKHLIGAKRANEAFCFISVYQTVHDFRGHHYLFGALTARQAYKNCEAGFAKSAR